MRPDPDDGLASADGSKLRMTTLLPGVIRNDDFVSPKGGTRPGPTKAKTARRTRQILQKGRFSGKGHSQGARPYEQRPKSRVPAASSGSRSSDASRTQSISASRSVHLTLDLAVDRSVHRALDRPIDRTTHLAVDRTMHPALDGASYEAGQRTVPRKVRRPSDLIDAESARNPASRAWYRPL